MNRIMMSRVRLLLLNLTAVKPMRLYTLQVMKTGIPLLEPPVISSMWRLFSGMDGNATWNRDFDTKITLVDPSGNIVENDDKVSGNVFSAVD